MHSPGVGFKLAHHKPAAPTEPDLVERDVLPGDEDSFRDCLRRYIPDADGPTLAMRTCLYTNSPDSHFIIDRHPRQRRVVVACGFSGHGFKFASVVGEALADIATMDKTDLPVAFLSLARFGGKGVTTERRRRTRPAKTTPAAAGERRGRSSQKASGVSISAWMSGVTATA